MLLPIISSPIGLPVPFVIPMKITMGPQHDRITFAMFSPCFSNFFPAEYSTTDVDGAADYDEFSLKGLITSKRFNFKKASSVTHRRGQKDLSPQAKELVFPIMDALTYGEPSKAKKSVLRKIEEQAEELAYLQRKCRELDPCTHCGRGFERGGEGHHHQPNDPAFDPRGFKVTCIVSPAGTNNPPFLGALR